MLDINDPKLGATLKCQSLAVSAADLRDDGKRTGIIVNDGVLNRIEVDGKRWEAAPRVVRRALAIAYWCRAGAEPKIQMVGQYDEQVRASVTDGNYAD